MTKNDNFSAFAAADEEQKKSLVNRISLLNLKEIQIAYTVDEMKEELRYLNRELKNLDPDHTDIKWDRQKYKSENSSALSACISSARSNLMKKDKNWMEDRKSNMMEEQDQQRIWKEQKFEGKMKKELYENDFFCLKGTDKYEAIKDIKFSFCNSHEGTDDDGDGDGAGIVLGSEHDDSATQGGQARVSWGGTKLERSNLRNFTFKK